MALNKVKLGEYIIQSDARNSDDRLGKDSVKGIATSKAFILTKANLHGVSLTNYKVVAPRQFAYVPDTSRRGDKISLAFNDENESYLVSSISVVFGVKPDCERHLLPEYLYLYFCRPEFDRYARFHSWGSAREAFSWEEMCKIEMELPPIDIQKKYVAVFKALIENRNSAGDVREICPILIRGAIEEGGKS